MGSSVTIVGVYMVYLSKELYLPRMVKVPPKVSKLLNQDAMIMPGPATLFRAYLYTVKAKPIGLDLSRSILKYAEVEDLLVDIVDRMQHNKVPRGLIEAWLEASWDDSDVLLREIAGTQGTEVTTSPHDVRPILDSDKPYHKVSLSGDRVDKKADSSTRPLSGARPNAIRRPKLSRF